MQISFQKLIPQTSFRKIGSQKSPYKIERRKIGPRKMGLLGNWSPLLISIIGSSIS